MVVAPLPSSQLRVAVVSQRPAVHALLRDMAEDAGNVTVFPVEVSPEGAASILPAFEQASLAVIDFSLEATGALDLCSELHASRPALPLVALVCCPQCLSPWHFAALLEGVFNGVFGLRSTPSEVQRTLEDVAQGECIIHLHLDRSERSLLRRIVGSSDQARAATVDLLQLLTMGLPDREIGRRLHLSPHTVKHHIEALREEVGARNRTELAAWAGRHGFYVPHPRESDSVVAPARAAKQN